MADLVRMGPPAQIDTETLANLLSTDHLIHIRPRVAMSGVSRRNFRNTNLGILPIYFCQKRDLPRVARQL